MAQQVTPRRSEAQGTPSDATAGSTRNLLLAGVIAGPLHVVVGFIQAFSRSGFELAKHPLSLLSLGNLGWVQITNFVVAGLLFIASAVGMRRILRSGPGRAWGPWLIGIFGAGLIAGGVFVADPAFGFPPGTPEGAPATLSWHGMLHAVAPIVGFNSLVAACFVFARRFAAFGQSGWAWYSGITGVLTLALSIWPNLTRPMNFLPLWAALVIGFAWPSVIAAKLMREQGR